MHLLVTGGSGFVMSHVIRQWVERGAAYELCKLGARIHDLQSMTANASK